jgi:hypothetical protein
MRTLVKSPWQSHCLNVGDGRGGKRRGAEIAENNNNHRGTEAMKTMLRLVSGRPCQSWEE